MNKLLGKICVFSSFAFGVLIVLNIRYGAVPGRGDSGRSGEESMGLLSWIGGIERVYHRGEALWLVF